MSPQKKPLGDEPSLRILPAIDEDEPGDQDSSEDLGEGERDFPDSDGQQFFRRLYALVVYVALLVVVATVGMLLTGYEIPGEMMLFFGSLVVYILSPLLYRILTDTPWSEISPENRETLKPVVKIVLAILTLIGLLAIRSAVISISDRRSDPLASPPPSPSEQRPDLDVGRHLRSGSFH